MSEQQMTPKSSSPQTDKSSATRYIILLGLVLLVLAGWSGFWLVSKNKTQDLIDKVLAKQINGQPVAICHDQTLGGFPFRLTLNCSSYEVNEPKSGWQIKGDALRALWQIYAPNLALIESDNQLTARHVSSGLEMDMKADLIRASVRLDGSLKIGRLSVESQNATLQSNLPQFAQSLGKLQAKRLEVHGRPVPGERDNLDIALVTQDLDSMSLPRFSGSLSFIIEKGLVSAIVTASNPTKAWLAQGGKVQNLYGIMEIGQKTLKLSGDLSFTQQGEANGDLALKILNPKPEAGRAKQALNAKQDGLNGPLTALQLMGKPISEGDLVGSNIDLTIRNGQISAGFLPLGQLPRLR
ncbi:MAG: DUF2125 domain-containing protein [Cohaesibacter sp.]|nr:DUF2125 domain-containing protein [Cohaesibacter sp.]MCV6601422.1 DUF2125 domain-containing protein [Cohaesibacter sp.]